MSILKNRSFTILFGGQLLSTIGNNLFGIALPWYIYLITQSKGDLVLAGVAQTLPAILGLFAGVFVDRWRKTTTMLLSDILRAGLCAGLILMILTKEPIWTVLLIVFALQCIGTFYGPAASALVPAIVHKSDIPKASGLQQSGNAIAQLIGTITGGALLTLLGPSLLFGLDGISFIISVVSVLLIRRQEPEHRAPSLSGPQAKSHRSFLREWMEGLQIFLYSRFLLLLMVCAVVANFSLAPLDITLTAWIKGPLHENALHLGLISAGFCIGMIIGSTLLGSISRKLALRWVLFIGLSGTGLFTMGIGLLANFWWDTALACCVGMCTGAANATINAALMQQISAAIRGRAFATLGSLGMLAMPLGMALFGALMVHLPLSLIFAIIGGVCLLSGLLFLVPIQDDLASLQSAHVEQGA